MRAALLSIGNELLRGDILDTNAQFLERELAQLGVDVVRVTQIGDDLKVLPQTVLGAVTEGDIVLCTGGLGPTADDLTRDAIADALGESLYEDADLVAELESRFSAMRRPMVASNLRQAQLIPSAEAVPNVNGSAPGWYVTKNNRIIAAMPGPPLEMQPMWRTEVLPRLVKVLSGTLASKGFMTFGLGESMLEHRIRDVIEWRPDVVVATYAKTTGVQVHVTARASKQQDADSLLAQAEIKLREHLNEFIFGIDNQTLSEVVGQRLTLLGTTLGVMESATGGQLSSMITDTTGSSDFFLGGIIAYSREIKERYGVPGSTIDQHGLYSKETATAMAHAARDATGAHIGLGVTGIAGSDDLEGKPAGTCFIAASLGSTNEVREVHRPGTRALTKVYFAQCALELLRKCLPADGSD